MELSVFENTFKNQLNFNIFKVFSSCALSSLKSASSCLKLVSSWCRRIIFGICEPLQKKMAQMTEKFVSIFLDVGFMFFRFFQLGCNLSSRSFFVVLPRGVEVDIFLIYVVVLIWDNPAWDNTIKMLQNPAIRLWDNTEYPKQYGSLFLIEFCSIFDVFWELFLYVFLSFLDFLCRLILDK